MNTREREDAAERWLDEALKDYGKVRCRPGMENRICAALKAHAERRQRTWILALTAASAVVLVAGMMSSLRPIREKVSAKNAGMKPAEPVQGASLASAHSLEGGSAKPVRHATRLVFAGQEHRPPEQLVLEKEKSYLAPVHHVEPEPLIALQKAAPEISIQDLGVRPIQVEELTPIRDMN